MKGSYIMEIKTTIFNSEIEFRKYVILNSDNVSQIIIFEDILDSTIFFYCFTKNSFIVATKEHTKKGIYFDGEIYQRVAKILKFEFAINLNNPLTIKLVK